MCDNTAKDTIISMQGRNRSSLANHRDNNEHVPTRTPSSTATDDERASTGSNSREADDSATNTIQTNAAATTTTTRSTTTTTTGQSEAGSTISQFASFFRERLHLDEELQSDNQSTNYEQADYEVPLRVERSSSTPISSRLHLDEELQSDNQSTNYEQADYEVPLRVERSSSTPISSRLHLDEELQSDNQSTNYEQADYEVPLRVERSSSTPISSIYGSSSKESHPFFDGRFIEVDGIIDLDPEWIEKQSRAKEQRRTQRRRGAWGRNAATRANSA